MSDSSDRYIKSITQHNKLIMNGLERKVIDNQKIAQTKWKTSIAENNAFRSARRYLLITNIYSIVLYDI